jgi:hypothetical protein
MGTGGSCSGIMQPQYEADHSPLCSAEVMNEWSYTATSPCALKAGYIPFYYYYYYYLYTYYYYYYYYYCY